MNKHEVSTVVTALESGGAPTKAMVHTMDELVALAHLEGATLTENGEQYWPDQDLYNAHFYATRCIKVMNQAIDAETKITTDETKARLAEDALYYARRVQLFLS